MDTNVRDQILAWIDQDRDALVQFLSRFVAIPSPNPPGDTTSAANFLLEHLRSHGFPSEIRAAKPHLPNIVGSFGIAAPHLVLNGHIDVFPSGPAESWSRDPWSGAVEDNRVHGRGVADMKCGTAASVWTAIYLHRLRDRLAGRLTLTCVSDEETGGTWGAQWLLDNFADECRGDCLLNGEPSAGTIRFGEKGTLRLVIEVSTPGAHAAYTYLSRNAIVIAATIVDELMALEDMPVTQSDTVRNAVENSRAVMDAAVGQGAGAILNRVTVCPGVIQGGVKINMLPGDCRIEVDIRLPVAMTHAAVMERINAIIHRHPEARVTPVWTHSCEPTFSDPGHRMVGILRDTVSGLTGRSAMPTVSLGASDAKHWRQRGVPSYLYGCAPNNMAKADEWVDVEEYVHVVRCHALAAAAYLAAG